MTKNNDNLSELLGHSKYKNIPLVTPEGVLMDVRIARRTQRVAALMIDLIIMGVVSLALSIAAYFVLFHSIGVSVIVTFFLFVIFLVRNFYFIHFELAWQGRTPGKKSVGIRVINIQGGELTPSAVVARNLTREVEIFLPLTLMVTMSGLETLATFGWVMVLVAIPFFNSYHLRIGDLIAGTVVIAMPKRVLLDDLAVSAGGVKFTINKYEFTDEQLSKYGNFELQVLEELLRNKNNNVNNMRVLKDVCDKICYKIGWHGTIADDEVIRFLTDFYTAERADLEKSQLYGKIKRDKHDS